MISQSKKDILLGLFFLILAYSYSIYFIIQAGLGLPAYGPFFKIYSASLALFVFILFFFNFRAIPSNIKVGGLFVCFVVVVSFYCTRFFYDVESDYYYSYFLSMGVRFVPSILAGLLMIKYDDIIGCIEKAVFPFVTLYTIVLASVVLNANAGANMGLTFNIEGGMNYQTMSYYSVFALGLTLFLLSRTENNKWERLLLLSYALLQIIMSLMTGGRGAFILALLFVFYYAKQNISRQNILFVVIGSLIVLAIFSYVFADNELLQRGFRRITMFFSDSSNFSRDERWIRWNLALDAFGENPLWGNGLGSVFYKVGFYSHNVFTDILCEGGILLMSLILYLGCSFAKKIRYMIDFDRRNEVLLIIFISSFVNLLFSGYYLAETGIWIALAYTRSWHSFILVPEQDD